MNARSTQAVVGLCGNDRMITRGLGQVSSQFSISESKNASPGVGAPPGSSWPGPGWPALGPSRRTWRTSAPANSGE